MSDVDDFTGDENENAGGKGLRAQLTAALAEKKDLADRLSKFETEHRTNTVSKIFSDKGLPAKAAKFYTDEDISEGAVGKWLEENADLFGVVDASSQTSTDEPDENSVNAQRVTQASFGNVHSVQETGDATIKGDLEEMTHLMKTASIEELQKLGYLPKDGSSAYSVKR